MIKELGSIEKTEQSKTDSEQQSAAKSIGRGPVAP